MCRHKTWKDGRKASVISETMAPQLEALLVLALESGARCEAKQKEVLEAAAGGLQQEFNHVKRICTTKVATTCNGHWSHSALLRCISLAEDIKAGRESERGERLEREFLERAGGSCARGREGGPAPDAGEPGEDGEMCLKFKSVSGLRSKQSKKRKRGEGGGGAEQGRGAGAAARGGMPPLPEAVQVAAGGQVGV